MNCPNCGNFNNQGTNFCTNCGHNLGNINNQSNVTVIPSEPIVSEENLNSQVNIQETNGSSTYNQVDSNVITGGVVNNINQNVTNDNVVMNNMMTNNNVNSSVLNSKNPINKKLIFILIGVGILIVVAIILVLIFTKKEDSADMGYMFDLNNPIPVLRDGKYGYITDSGDVLLEPIYNSIGNFYGGYAAVSIDNPDTTANNESIYLIIDKEGNIINDYEIYSKPVYYPEYKIWLIDSSLYDSNINRISAENLEISYLGNGYSVWRDDDLDTSGIMNSKGKVTYTYTPNTDDFVYAMYDISDNSDLFEEDYCRVNVSNEVYAIVNCETGEIVYDFTEYYIADGKNNIFSISNHDTFKTITTIYVYKNKIVYQTKNSDGDISYQSDGYIKIKDGDVKYIDVTTGKILSQKPEVGEYDIDAIDLINESIYGYRIVETSGDYGLVSNNKEVLPVEFDDIEFLGSDLFNYIKRENGQELVLVEQDDKTLLMNIKNKKVITTFESTSINHYEDSSFLKISLYEENKYRPTGYTIYNILSGKSMKFDTQSKIDIKSNYITVENDNKRIYYNAELERIYEEDVRNG